MTLVVYYRDTGEIEILAPGETGGGQVLIESPEWTWS